MFQKHVKDKTMQKQEEFRGNSPGADTQRRGTSQVIHYPSWLLITRGGVQIAIPSTCLLMSESF